MSAIIARVNAKYPVPPYAFVRRLRPSAIPESRIAFKVRVRPEVGRNVLTSIPSKTLALIEARTTRANTYTSTAKSCHPRLRLTRPSGELSKTPVNTNASTTGIVSSPASSRACVSGSCAKRTALTIADRAAIATGTYGGARTSAATTTAGESVR